MIVQDRQVEKTGPGFNREVLMAARATTWRAVERIAQAIHVGMLEEDAYEAARTILNGMGSAKNWHRPWIRFGVNTLKPYGVLSTRGAHLKEEDIFFIDIGPVWGGYEGDAGSTFVTGFDKEMKRCQADVKTIFNAVKERWCREHETGKGLYDFAVRKTEELGWRLNLRANGHRLSDFPHAIYFKGGLAEVGFAPSPDAWMLEIQICHPDNPFGAFYEDLLIHENYKSA